jgi:predicted P-loop ATPase
MRDLDRAIRSKRNRLPRGGRGDGGGPEGPDDDWHVRLLRSPNGAVRANLANAVIALRHAPEWNGVLWRNDFAECTIARARPPIAAADGKWTNLHDMLTTDWLQRNGIDVSIQVAGHAVECVANDRRFHPPREYLMSLKWDGTPRLDSWLRTYLGATVDESIVAPIEWQSREKPTGYLESIGAKWLISAVARVMKPGCKADCALVLEGEQGIRKSSALRALGGEWFTDQIAQLGSKDSSMQTHGIWIIEIAELGSMSKAEVDVVKDFMSRQEERYRPPYAGRVIEVPRQCVFAGSVNPGEYLRDDTGGRRFWPVACGRIDLEGLGRDRDQIWAEAKCRYDEGSTWWLDVPEVLAIAEQEQADRYRTDPWDSNIRNFLRYEGDSEVSVEKLLHEVLGIPLDRRSQTDANRVASILRANGWRKQRIGPPTGRRYVYKPHTPAARLAAARQETLQAERV